MTSGTVNADAKNQSNKSKPHLFSETRWNSRRKKPVNANLNPALLASVACGVAVLKFEFALAGTSSTTNNNAQAANIQLNNKGMTEVDGALVKGFNQGSIKQTTSNKRFASNCGFLKICISRFSWA
jgi:hypothetical protein